MGLHELEAHQKLELTNHKLMMGIAGGEFFRRDPTQEVIGPPPNAYSLPPTPKQPIESFSHEPDKFFTPTFVELPTSDEEDNPQNPQEEPQEQAGLPQGSGAGPTYFLHSSNPDELIQPPGHFQEDLPQMEDLTNWPVELDYYPLQRLQSR